jgi:hypothetical protein
LYFLRLFLLEKRHGNTGSTNCVEIQTDKLGRSYRLTDPKEYEKFIRAKDYVKCPQIVGKIARMTAEFILDYQTKKQKYKVLRNNPLPVKIGTACHGKDDARQIRCQGSG